MVNSVLLITGATGFLGSRLLEKFVELGASCVLLKRVESNTARIAHLLPKCRAVYNLEENGIRAAFRDHPIDGVVHCATDYGRSHKEPLHIVEANLILPLTLLHYGRRHGLKIFLNTAKLLDKRVNEYSLSKAQFYDWLKIASSELVAVNVALEHFFGPGDDQSKFVSWIIGSVLRGEPSIPLTLGEQRRDFIFIDDVVEAFAIILKRSLSLEIGLHHFEVGSGHTTSIRELVELISERCHPHQTRFDFGAIPYRINEVMESKVDLGPLRELGWNARLNLADGLTQTIDMEKSLRKGLSV